MLPPLVRLDDCGGDWATYVEVVYGHFRGGFLGDDAGEFEGLRVAVAERHLVDGKEQTFWHIVTKERLVGKRANDPQRCERVCWARRLLDLARAGDAAVVWWRKRHRQEQRIYIALNDFSYVVVFVEKTANLGLITAFPVEHGHERRKLKKQWQRAGKS